MAIAGARTRSGRTQLIRHERPEVTDSAAEIRHEMRVALRAANFDVARLREALREMVYETTHLSQREDDGSHICKISGKTLAMARAALQLK